MNRYWKRQINHKLIKKWNLNSIESKPRAGVYSKTSIMTIELFWDLIYSGKDKEWFGLVANICPYNKVELSLCVEDDNF